MDKGLCLQSWDGVLLFSAKMLDLNPTLSHVLGLFLFFHIFILQQSQDPLYYHYNLFVSYYLGNSPLPY